MNEIFRPDQESSNGRVQNIEQVANTYGRKKFTPEHAEESLEAFIVDFKDYYRQLGYIEHPPVKITSGIDPTVRFIGSHISVFKPYLLKGTILTPGYFMKQDCVRVRNADRLLDDDYLPRWGSYFHSLGTITPPERLHDICKESFAFFEHCLNIPKDHIRLRVRSEDTDLMEACQDHYGPQNLEVDSRQPQYYRHQLGLENVWGRNFNIALRDQGTEIFSDVGNIIIIESPQKKLGVELALGSTTILKQLYGLDHVLDCTPVIGLRCADEGMRRRFEDAMLTSMVLFREGLRPSGQHNRNRILRRYVRSMSYFRAKAGMSLEELADILYDVETHQFSSGTQGITASTIIEFMKSFESELKHKKQRTEEEEKIFLALRSTSPIQ